MFADAGRRAVLLIAEGNEAATVEGFEANLCLHCGKPTQIEALSMDMWPAFIKGLRWALLKDRWKLRTEQRADLDELVAHITTKGTARAWLYREQLRDIMSRRQPDVVRALLKQSCTNVMRSKVEPRIELCEDLPRLWLAYDSLISSIALLPDVHEGPESQRRSGCLHAPFARGSRYVFRGEQRGARQGRLAVPCVLEQLHQYQRTGQQRHGVGMLCIDTQQS